jgi:beta-glucuronidase
MIELNGFWDFAFSEDDSVLPREFDRVMPVPGCFDVTPDLWGKRGIGFYRTTIELSEELNHRLSIGGVAHDASIYLDGEQLRQHHGAFTAIEIDLPEVKTGTHELIIAADNRFDGVNRPLHMDYFDWYSYGGIIRPVYLKPYRQVLIERINPVTQDWRKGKVAVDVIFQSDQAAPSRLPVKIDVDGSELYSGSVNTEGNSIQIDIDVPDPAPWSPEDPHLYRLTVQLGDDAKSVNLGLRQIRTDGHQILLNDTPVRIKGINRHDCHVQLGFALPASLQLTDVQLIKRLGCNFLRTSHYPPDQGIIDLCDKLGLMVWCETTSWQYSEEMLSDERVIGAQRQCTTEMIQQYGHHPSIVCWGMLNECASYAESARATYKELAGLIRELDPSRPVTFSSSRVQPEPDKGKVVNYDLMFDLVDWIAVNVYPGWYVGDLDDCDEWVEKLAETLHAEGCDKKPIIISEIGAGGIAGFEHYNPIKWSLSYQSELLRKVLNTIRDQKIFSGVCIWQFCDIRTGEKSWAHRPKDYNNKGLVDEYRRCKPAYAEVKSIYEKDWI